MTNRCAWAEGDPLLRQYHDIEWGTPEKKSERLFAKLILDGAQAGLSWVTVLRKKDAYYRAFDGLSPDKMAHYDDARIAELLANPAIIRNRQKIHSAVKNARAYLGLRERGIDFADFIWSFTEGHTIQNAWIDDQDLPATSTESEAMSRALKEHGFSFVGPTICYAFMQAIGMVNDHVVSCFRHPQLSNKNS